MSLTDQIKKQVELKTGEIIISAHQVGGGSISEAYKISTASGRNLFLKINTYVPDDMFTKEKNGLNELHKSGSIKTPEVLLVDSSFILLEFISSAVVSKKSFDDFGKRFALLHKYSGNSFGFYEDNYIGSTAQINIADEDELKDWKIFYYNKRILFQYKLAEKNGYASKELTEAIIKLENKMEYILSGSYEKPSLLHGDLWSGNFIIDESGNACLIDPAVYYGNREADLAMTKLFGGFPSRFYESYNEVYPLKDGYDYRENLYKLYHVMNHLNLFGMSYYSQAISLLNYYLK